MRRADVNLLDLRRHYWVAAVYAPCANWTAAPGCTPGERFLVDRHRFRPTRDRLTLFASKSRCLRWILRHRRTLNGSLYNARVEAVRLDRWLLGLEEISTDIF